MVDETERFGIFGEDGEDVYADEVEDSSVAGGIADEAGLPEDEDEGDVSAIMERLEAMDMDIGEEEPERPAYSKRVIRDASMEEDMISANALLEKELLDLNIARNQRRRLTLPVTKIDYEDEPSDGSMGLYAIGSYGRMGIPVRIPVEEFMPDIPTEDAPRRPGSREMSTPRQQAARYLNRHLGGKANVVVTEIGNARRGEVPEIRASRLQAMRMDRARHYFTDNRDQLYEIGCIVPARITSVYERFLYVEVAGVEVRINQEDMGYTFLPDLRTLYKPGQVINVCITDLEVDEDARMINRLSVSKKEAEDDPRDKAFDNYHPGMEAYGTVIRNLPTGSIVDLGDGMTALAAYNEGFTRPENGTDVIIRIIRTDPARKRLYGFLRSKSLLKDI